MQADEGSTSRNPVSSAARAALEENSGPISAGAAVSGAVAGRLYSAAVFSPDSRLAGAATLVAMRASARRGASAVLAAAMGPAGPSEETLPHAIHPFTVQVTPAKNVP